MEITVKIKVKDGVEIELTAEEVEALRKALAAFGEEKVVYRGWPYWYDYRKWTTPHVTFDRDPTLTNGYTMTLLAAGE
jgi:hypothetical protein